MIITLPNVFIAGQVLTALELNQNFQTIYNDYNGNITNSNIASTAGITLNKLALNPGSIAFNKQVTGNITWASGLTSDAQPRVAMTSDGWLEFGPGGSTAPPVYLVYEATNTLQLNPAGSTLDMQTGSIINVSNISGTTAPAACGGRLYLTSGMPYQDTNATGTLYFGSNAREFSGQININGTLQPFSEVSMSLSALTASTVYDIYVNSASSTTVTLSTVAWSGINTPPTRSKDSYGRLVKNGTPADLLVGAIYVNASNQTVDNTSSRQVSNIYSTVPRAMSASDPNPATATSSIAPVDGNTTDGVGRVSFISVVSNQGFSFSYAQSVFLSTSATGTIGLGLNSTSAYTVNAIISSVGSSESLSVNYAASTTAGYNYMQKLCQFTLNGLTLDASPSNFLSGTINN